MGKISYNLGYLWNVSTFLIYFLKFGNKSENSVNFPQIYEIFSLSVGKSMLPKDLGKISYYSNINFYNYYRVNTEKNEFLI